MRFWMIEMFMAIKERLWSGRGSEICVQKPFYENGSDGMIDVGYKLPNGVRLLLVERKGMKNIDIRINISVGRHNDPPEYPGMAHLMEHVTFHGEAGRDFLRYGYKQDHKQLGITYVYNTRFNIMIPEPDGVESIEKSVAKRLVTKLVELLCDPVIDEKSVTAELEAIDIEDMLRRKVRKYLRPVWTVYEMVSSLLGGSGDKRSLMGDAKNVKGLITELKDFHKKSYVGEKCTVLLGGGNLEILKLLGKEFERIPRGEGDVQEKNVDVTVLPEYREKIISVQKESTKDPEKVFFMINIQRSSPWRVFNEDHFEDIAKRELVALDEGFAKGEMSCAGVITCNGPDRIIIVCIHGFCPRIGDEMKKLRNIISRCLEEVGGAEQRNLGLSREQKQHNSLTNTCRMNWTDLSKHIEGEVQKHLALENILSVESGDSIREWEIKNSPKMVANTSEWITIRFENEGEYNMEERWTGMKYRMNSYEDSSVMVLHPEGENATMKKKLWGIGDFQRFSRELVGQKEIIMGEIICRILSGDLHAHFRKKGLVYGSDIYSLKKHKLGCKDEKERTVLKFHVQGALSEGRNITLAMGEFIKDCPDILRKLSDDEWREMVLYVVGLIIDGEFKVPSSIEDKDVINIDKGELSRMKEEKRLKEYIGTQRDAADILSKILEDSGFCEFIRVGEDDLGAEQQHIWLEVG
jgi:hypothetical protein